MRDLDWLLHGDPAISWQVLADLTDAPAAVVSEQRARIATHGWGAALLGLRGADGTWAGDSLSALTLLRELGIDPRSAPMREVVAAVQPTRLLGGGLDPGVNGLTLAAAAYLEVDAHHLRDRVLDAQRSDGGWGRTGLSTFDVTICALEGLLAYDGKHGSSGRSLRARRAGEQLLLRRRLFPRVTQDEASGRFALPTAVHYDVLRGLDHFRRTGEEPDPALRDAVRVVAGQRLADNTWALDDTHPHPGPFELEPPGGPSRWLTLRALRVLDWWNG